MRGKLTGWLLVLVAGVAAYIFMFERHTLDSGQHAARAQRLLPDFNAVAVRSINLSSTNPLLNAERDGRSWKLTAPVVYPARTAAVESFLTAIGELTSDHRIDGKELSRQSNGLAAFGLQPPRSTLKLQMETNEVELRFGSMTPVGEKLYFQIVGLDGVFATGSNFFNRLPKLANDWRDPALVRTEGLSFNRVEIRSGSVGFEVQRDATNQLWRLTKPMPARADNPKLEHLLHDLKNWLAVAFVTDDPKAELEPLGLQTPDLELILGQGTNDVAAVQFGKSPTNQPTLVYARRLSHTNIVLVARSVTEPLRQPFSAYRDRRLASFDAATVDVVEVRGEDFFTLRRQTNDEWRVTEPLNFAADRAIVEEMVKTLGTLEILDFVKDVVTDFSSYGLAKPVRQYTLRNGTASTTNPPMVQIEIGTNQLDRVFAHRADESSVYAIPFGSVYRLPQSLYQVRDRRLWNFSSTNVVNVVIRQNGKTLKLVRDTAREWTAEPAGDKKLNSVAIDEVLLRLGQLQATAWVARGADKRAQFGFTPNNLRLELEIAAGEKTQTHAVDFGGLSPARRAYAAMPLEGETIIFEFPTSLFEMVVTYLTIPPGP